MSAHVCTLSDVDVLNLTTCIFPTFLCRVLPVPLVGMVSPVSLDLLGLLDLLDPLALVE